MTRLELEALCKPQSPEEVLDGLQELHAYLDTSAVTATEDSDLYSLNAGIEILKKTIEQANGRDLPPSVQVRRIMF